MSVKTPILTTSSEICALAAPPDAANASPAINTAANDFIMVTPWCCLAIFLFLIGHFNRPARTRKA
jgi:hypothetical protein